MCVCVCLMRKCQLKMMKRVVNEKDRNFYSNFITSSTHAKSVYVCVCERVRERERDFIIDRTLSRKS